MKQLLLSLTVCLLSMSCATNKFSILSNVDNTNEINLKNVLISIDTTHPNTEYLAPFPKKYEFKKALISKLKSEFKNYNIECYNYEITGLELDKTKIEEEISKNSINYLLYLKHLSNTTSDTTTVKQTYNIKLIEVGTDKTIWVANIEIEREPIFFAGGINEESVDILVEGLFKKLLQDQVI